MKIPEFVITIYFSKWSCSKKISTTLFLKKRLNHSTFSRKPRDKIQSTKEHYYYKDISDAFPFFWFKHGKVMAKNVLHQNSFSRIRMFIDSIKNYLLIKNSIVWLDPNLTACTIQFELDDFFFAYFLGVFSWWKHL